MVWGDAAGVVMSTPKIKTTQKRLSRYSFILEAAFDASVKPSPSACHRG
jgi:hypothetical protein